MKTGSAVDKWKETKTVTSRDRDWIRQLQELFGGLGEVTIKPNPKKSLVFRMHLTKSMCSTLIEDLDLSVRACHCLKRAGYNTLGELAQALEEGVDLYKLRNCGKTTVQEIQAHLLLFQYNSLRPERREDYLLEVVALNCI